MCCRYFLEESPELRPFVEAAKQSSLREKLVAKLARPLVTSGEVRPTDLVPVLAPSPRQLPTVYPMVWGFGGKITPILNARWETAAAKPLFRESWAKRRCAIPASWYYEWEHRSSPEGKRKTGDKYMIQPRGARLLFLAGLYRLEDREGMIVPTFTVLTREATEELRHIHDRMPVMLPETAVDAWLRPDCDQNGILRQALCDMVLEPAGEAS